MVTWLEILVYFAVIANSLALSYVDTVTWNNSVIFADYLSNRASPVVIKGILPYSWKILKLWDFDYIVSHMKGDNVTGFYRNNHPVMGPFYDPLRPMNSLKSIIRRNPYDINASIPKSLISSVFQSDSKNHATYWSYNGGIDDIDPALFDDFTPFDEFIRLFPSRSSINLWMGMKGIITPCHYDGYHNVVRIAVFVELLQYVQVKGEKQFRLFPPYASSNFHMYPYLHPSFGQCQANLTDLDDSDLYPSMNRGLETELRAHLHPGDVLYIPPFWIHEVTSLTPSISLNFWTDVADSDIMSKIMAIPLPQDPKIVLHSIPCEIMLDLFRTRFAPLMLSGVFPNIVIPLADMSQSCPLDTKTYVTSVFELFDTMDQSTAKIWKENFVEYVTASFIRLDYIGSYLKHFLGAYC